MNDLALLTKYIQFLNQEIFTNCENQTSYIADLAREDENLSARNIIKLMPGNVFWKDKEGRYLGINNNVAQLLQLKSADDVIGKRNCDIMDSQYASDLDQFDKKCIESGQGMFFEEPGFDQNNQPAIYFTQKLPLKDEDGEVIGLVGISMDITERKRIETELQLAKEQAEISSQAKSQFLAVVNHELRTPLTGILGLINMLKENSGSPDETKHTINNLDNCAQYLLTLVNDILDFTKLDANGAAAHVSPVNFNYLLHEVCGILDGLAKNKGLAFTYAVQANLPLLLTDDQSFKQILINLINNAIKFTANGGIDVRLNYTSLPNQKIFLELKVTDTGPGIPADKLDIIFEPFQQLENIYIRQSSRSGTGLGLAIVKRLTQSLNCEIHVESEVNKGSSFIISGEFDIAQEVYESFGSYVKEQTESTPSKQIRVLLVEDDKIVQFIHQRMLADLNCSVHAAASGEQALIHPKPYDIAFVDIGLSDMTGFKLIENLRIQQQQQGYTFPIIVLTGYTGEQEKIAALNAGANEVLIKPVSIEKLKSVLQKYAL